MESGLEQVSLQVLKPGPNEEDLFSSKDEKHYKISSNKGSTDNLLMNAQRNNKSIHRSLTICQYYLFIVISDKHNHHEKGCSIGASGYEASQLFLGLQRET